MGAHLLLRGKVRVPEDMGVAPQHLGADPRYHVRKGKGALLLRHAGVEDHLKQQVPQLTAQIAQVPALDGLRHLVGLLQRIGQDAAKVLLQVPGAPAIGVAQPGHDGQQVSHGRGVSHGVVS